MGMMILSSIENSVFFLWLHNFHYLNGGEKRQYQLRISAKNIGSIYHPLAKNDVKIIKKKEASAIKKNLYLLTVDL